MTLGHRHQIRRKGLPKTARTKLIRSVDVLAYLVSILSLFFTLDQIRIIWVEQDADGVSLISWAFYALSNIVWFWYGFLHKERILVITNFIWVIFSIVIIAGVVMHR